MAIKRAAIGTQLQAGNAASPEIFTYIAAVGNISGPGVKADTMDVTSQDTPNYWKQFLTTLKEGGDIKFELYFDVNDTTQGNTAPSGGSSPGALYVFAQREAINWRIQPPLYSPVIYWAFAGYVTQFEPDYKVSGVQTASCTIKVTGQPFLGGSAL